MAIRKVITGVRQEASRPIGLVAGLVNLAASIIALSNTFFSPLNFNHLTDGKTGNMLPVLPAFGFPLRILLFLFLEACLAHIFGLLLATTFSRGRGLPVVFTTLLCLVASWTSLLNNQLLILRGQPATTLEYGLFSGAALVSLILGRYLIVVHWERLCERHPSFSRVRFSGVLLDQSRTLVRIREVSFVGMYLVLLGLAIYR